ncbi:MAG: STAS/SEC14 domain-containing protein [Ilumatobacteraceae bacterium]
MMQLIENLPGQRRRDPCDRRGRGRRLRRRVLVPAIEAAQASHDKIRLLYVLGEEFTATRPMRCGRTPSPVPARSPPTTRSRWSPTPRGRSGPSALRLMIPGEVRTFHTDALDEATAWISA